MCIIEAVQQHIDTIWCGFNGQNATHKRSLCCRPVSICWYICPFVCQVGGSYCQTSFRPDCPIIRIFDLQRWYPIPRETLSSREGQKFWGNGKILWLLANQSQYIRINSMRKFSALFNNSVGKCCLHSFYYIFSIYFHCSASIPYRGQKANWLYH